MPSVVLALGAAAARSPEITLAAGERANFIMSSGSMGAGGAYLQVKDASGGWTTVATFDWRHEKRRAQSLEGPLTCSVYRPAQGAPTWVVGVDRA